MDEIVVGIDGSAASDAALRFAADEARAHGWRLVAVHAWTLPVVVGPPFTLPPALDMADFEGAAKEVLAHALDRGLGRDRGELPVEVLVVEGGAADALVARAASARELVVGARGHGGFAGLLLGSVSQRCANHAPCPVVIVPAVAAP